MNDPFERLFSSGDVEDASVDVGAIKSRARRIQRRRYVALGSSAALIAAVAFAGVLWSPLAEDGRQIASESEKSESTPVEGEVQGATGATAPARVKGSRAAGGARQEDAAVAAPEAASQDERGAPTAHTGSGPPPAELVLTLEVKEAGVTERGAQFTLDACNPHEYQTIVRDFSSAQRYDFAVERDDEVVWRWSDGMMFAQQAGQETWEPGECKNWTESWDGTTSSGAPATSGEYVATGVLKSTKEQHTKAEAFCLDVC